MLLVTHDLDDAGLLGDRIAVLLDGHVAQVARPATLFARPATLGVARFLGIFQELPGRMRSDGSAECALGVVPVRTDADHPGAVPASSELPAARPVTVVCRAESLRVRRRVDAPATAAVGEVQARVVGMRHRARGTTVAMRLEGGTTAMQVEATVCPYDPPLAAGDTVDVVLDPGGAIVYPA